MKNQNYLCAGLLFSLSICQVGAQSHLRTELLEHTDVVYDNGHISSITLPETESMANAMQVSRINSPKPTLGWVVAGSSNGTRQTAYRILMASSLPLLTEDDADVWDSGKVISEMSTAVPYGGLPLQASTIYYWKVKVWDNHGNESNYSAPKSFMTAKKLTGATSSYPLQMTDEFPVTVKKINDTETFVGFDKTAFGKLYLTLRSETERDTVIVRLGEKQENDQVARQPGGSIRYSEYRLPLKKGCHTYNLRFSADKRNTDTARNNESRVLPILMPNYIGEVYPFRFCEIGNYRHSISSTDIRRENVNYPFDDYASYFHCSDTILNKVWDMCKYSIKATSFSGIYVDGDRERIAYEADALIGQLGHYSTDREFSMARLSHEHLLHNPTWPTEWNLQSVIIAWNDYMYTADRRSLEKFYNILKAKTLSALKDSNGLISTRTGKQIPELYDSLNFRGKVIRDIVDWPQNGYVGKEKERAGEADGFEFTNYNTVVNAFHYRALILMSKIASVLGKEKDAEKYYEEANRTKSQFNRLLFNKETGHYRDGVETDHESLHGNMFPLAFGLVTPDNLNSVVDYVKSRGMACSVYGAQFLLDALYDNNEGIYALGLLSSVSERSWYNMLRSGSTITMEAWDDKYKPNQDWNHVWGAVPANIIPRGLFGIQPTSPGFATFRIKPQPATLRHAELKLPTIKGDISARFENIPGKQFTLIVTIPNNTRAEVMMPKSGSSNKIKINGRSVKGKTMGQYIATILEPGTYRLES